MSQRVTLVCAALVIGLVSTEASSGPYQSLGLGNSSCATWLSSTPFFASGKDYILGLWTGLNMFNPKGHTMVGSSTDTNGIVGEIKLYCEVNPSKILVDAAAETYLKFDQRENNWK